MKQKLRIIHCFRAPVGGVFRHVRDLCIAQVAEGHDVGIVCDSTTGGEHEKRILNEIAPHLPLGVTRIPMQREIGIGDLSAAWRTYQALKTMRPDILHGHGAKGGVYARMFGTLMRLAGQRPARLYAPHGGSLHYDARSLKGRVFFTLENLMTRITDHLFFVSAFEKKTFERKVGAPRAPFSLVYNGLNDDEFLPVKARSDAADFLFVGTMRDLKGPDIFIDALAQAQTRLGRDLSAVMVGEGEDREHCIAQANALGFGHRIAFLPAMPARQAFALGRTMVVPSRAEAFPYIVLEALAAGRPLIASAVGGIPEVFGEGAPALSAPNAAKIADKMVLAHGDESAFLKTMPSQDDLKARFSSKLMAQDIGAIYQALSGTFPALARES